MKRDMFAIAFLGIFLLVVVLFFVVFAVISAKGVDDGSRSALWAALTILILLFGVIGISLFLNRERH
ncbi:MAG: hypothetical protein KKD18_03950 [Nanoarchaeota archaeon]|nr:hypothetical protein [Nanoarchaeota archaeon]MBU0977545.1 hypothetical protein [Nanoarchaeota archaeon]